MQYLILGLLLFGDATIYDLNRQFAQNLSLIYAASYGSLQVAIKKLLKEGHITFIETVEDGRNKKIYSITKSGMNVFYDWMLGPVTVSKLETEMLSKIYFLGLIESTDEKKHIIKGYLEEAEIALTSLLSTKEQVSHITLPQEHQTIAHYQFKTLDYGISAHENAVIWLKEMLAHMS